MAAIANVTFTHDHDADSGASTAEEPVAIGEPTATAPATGFYYTLSQPAVTVTYNLLTGISVAPPPSKTTTAPPTQTQHGRPQAPPAAPSAASPLASLSGWL